MVYVYSRSVPIYSAMAGSSRTLDVILYIDRQRQLVEVGCGLSIVRDLHASLLQIRHVGTIQARACFLLRRSSRRDGARLVGLESPYM